MQTNGLYVSPVIAEVLYIQALGLVRDKDHRIAFKLGELGEVKLTTEYQVICVEHFGGVKFEARVAMGNRDFDVSFVIDSRFLEEYVPGFWTCGCAADAQPQPPRQLN
ncbi:MAG: hypothetical protein WC892_01780 [Patescibacteria group bacterium]